MPIFFYSPKLWFHELGYKRIEPLLKLPDFLFEKSDDSDIKIESLSCLPSSSANQDKILIVSLELLQMHEKN